MASTSTQTAPLWSSSSSSTPSWKYEVFISFHGGDNRYRLADLLHDALEKNGIIVFRDDKRMERGEYISKELFKAIEESQYAIVVISKNYAFSKWCLKELAKIMERMRERRLKVFPVFDDVDPSDVRNLRGNFEKAFEVHRREMVDEEQRKTWRAALEKAGDCLVDPPNGGGKQEVQFVKAFARNRDDPEVNKEDPFDTWRSAFIEAGHLVGWHVHNRPVSIILKEISATIVGGLMRNLSEVPKFLVGMDAQVMEMWRLLGIGSGNIRFVGICGMGGIGKTTLARVIYERVSSQFVAKCFIARIGEASGKNLVRLQKYLISTILTETVANMLNDFDDVYEGVKLLGNRLRMKNVFIVLDDVSQKEQIEALAGSPEWFGEGSRIIITSRNRDLPHLSTNNIYDVKKLNNSDAFQLFCSKAFNKRNLEESFVRLIEDIVDFAKGLPLGLEVFGSYLCNAKKSEWESYLVRVKTNLDANVSKKLKITFDGLTNLAQEAFLDIACFFNGWYEDDVVSKLKSLGYHSESILKDLEGKSLIKFSEYGELFMHDLLAKMGEEIAGHSRLWRTEDIILILRKKTGIGEVKGINLKLPLPEEEQLCFEAFSTMKNLRMIRISIDGDEDDELGGLNIDPKVTWYGEPLKFKLSDELRVIKWWRYPLEFLSMDSSFEPANLVELILPQSHIVRLWDGQKRLLELKHVDLSFSKNLIEIPNLSRVSNLEILNLSYCECLSTINSSIGCLKRLKQLLLHGCCSLEQLPDKISSKSLEVVDLFGCSRLENFPEIPSNMPFLLSLNISWTAIKELPFSSVRFPSLEEFYADGADLRELPSSIVFSGNLTFLSVMRYGSNSSCRLPTSFSASSSLKSLTLGGCILSNEAETIDLSGLSSLTYLDLSFNKFTKIPNIVGQVPSLCELHMSSCSKLIELPEALFSSLRSLLELSLRDCNLRTIPKSIGCCSSVISLDLSMNRFTKLPNNMCELSSLRELILDDSILLQALPKLPLRLCYLGLRNCPLLDTFDSQVAKKISREKLQASVCSSTVAYIGFDGKPHQILYLDPQSPPYENDHAHLIELTVACGPTQGLVIPEWFIHRSIGSYKEIQIHMDWNFGDDIFIPRACALLIFYDVHGHDEREMRKLKVSKRENSDRGAYEGTNHILPEFICKLEVNEASPERTMVFCLPKVACIGSHGVWVVINIPDSFKGLLSMRGWSYRVSIAASSENVLLKEGGARLLSLQSDSEFSQVVANICQLGFNAQIHDYYFHRFVNIIGPIK